MTAPNVSPDRVRFATHIFLREITRQYIILHPSKFAAGNMPVKPLSDYPVAQQRAINTAISKAVEAALGMDDLFADFVTKNPTD